MQDYDVKAANVDEYIPVLPWLKFETDPRYASLNYVLQLRKIVQKLTLACHKSKFRERKLEDLLIRANADAENTQRMLKICIWHEKMEAEKIQSQMTAQHELELQEMRNKLLANRN